MFTETKSLSLTAFQSLSLHSTLLVVMHWEAEQETVRSVSAAIVYYHVPVKQGQIQPQYGWCFYWGNPLACLNALFTCMIPCWELVSGFQGTVCNVPNAAHKVTSQRLQVSNRKPKQLVFAWFHAFMHQPAGGLLVWFENLIQRVTLAVFSMILPRKH